MDSICGGITWLFNKYADGSVPKLSMFSSGRYRNGRSAPTACMRPTEYSEILVAAGFRCTTGLPREYGELKDIELVQTPAFVVLRRRHNRYFQLRQGKREFVLFQYLVR